MLYYIIVILFMIKRQYYYKRWLIKYFERWYNKIISIVIFYIISIILIKYNTPNIDIIIFKTSNIKYNVLKLVYQIAHP